MNRTVLKTRLSTLPTALRVLGGAVAYSLVACSSSLEAHEELRAGETAPATITTAPQAQCVIAGGSSTDGLTMHSNARIGAATFTAVGDFNADGLDDVALLPMRDASDYLGPPEAHIFFGPLCRPSVTARDWYRDSDQLIAPVTGQLNYGAFAFDADGNGTKDLVVVGYNRRIGATSPALKTTLDIRYAPLASGRHLTITATETSGPMWLRGGADGRRQVVAIGDVTGDRIPDFGSISYPGTTTNLVIVAGPIAVDSREIVIASGTSERPVVVGDLNGDGVAEFASTGGGALGRSIRLCRGPVLSPAGCITSSAFDLEPGFALIGSAGSDVNGDGFVDLIGASPSRGGISYYVKTISGKDLSVISATSLTYSDYMARYGISVGAKVSGDFNGDGIVDKGVGDPAAGLQRWSVNCDGGPWGTYYDCSPNTWGSFTATFGTRK